MAHIIEISDEEISQLQTILDEGIARTHEELRRTENFKYREVLRHNLEVMDRILKLVRTAKTAASAV